MTRPPLAADRMFTNPPPRLPTGNHRISRSGRGNLWKDTNPSPTQRILSAEGQHLKNEGRVSRWDLVDSCAGLVSSKKLNTLLRLMSNETNKQNKGIIFLTIKHDFKSHKAAIGAFWLLDIQNMLR